MRVRMVPSVKHVTLVGTDERTRRVVPAIRMSSRSDSLKFTLIDKDGQVSRGRIELALGDIKKESRLFRPVERRLRKLIRAEYRALGKYLVLHDRSRRRHKNGWAKDFGENLIQVVRRR